jgi:Zn-ribbon protein, possibly nucleic acid-binding
LRLKKKNFCWKKKNSKKKKIEIEIALKSLREQSDSLRVQRKVIVDAGIKPEVLALYERILENRGELAIVPVRDDACSGCYMSMRPQVVNELRLGKLLTCENCSRILYVENNE